MNIFRMTFCLCLLLLVSCAAQKEVTVAKEKHAKRIIEAAKINTQLGLAYLKQGNRPRAKSKLLNALSLAPQSADVNAGFAYYLERSGDFDKADQYYQRAIKYSANSGAQLNNYGAFLCRNKRYKEAEQFFLKAVDDVKYINAAGAYENAGLCAEASGNDKLAITYFKKALVQDPQRKPSMIEALQLLARDHQDRNALMLLKKYPELTYEDRSLLKRGIELAQKTQDTKTLALYQTQLQSLTQLAKAHSGEKYDHG